MTRFVLPILAVVLLGAAGAAAFILSGAYNVAATEPHWSATRWVLETVRTRSIKAHAAGVAVPPGLDDPARLPAGMEHYATHCSVCHGGPGVAKGDIAEGLYPQPPDLTGASARYTPAELFWILKNGIKMTGMPSWADHGDDALWATVALLRRLPGMSPGDFAELRRAALGQGGTHHHPVEAGSAAVEQGRGHAHGDRQAAPAVPRAHESHGMGP